MLPLKKYLSFIWNISPRAFQIMFFIFLKTLLKLFTLIILKVLSPVSIAVISSIIKPPFLHELNIILPIYLVFLKNGMRLVIRAFKRKYRHCSISYDSGEILRVKRF